MVKNLCITVGISVVILKFFILLLNSPPISTQEAEQAYFAYSIGSVQNSNFWEFGKLHGYTLFFIPTLILKFIFIFIKPTFIIIRIVSFFLAVIASFSFSIITIRLTNVRKRYSLPLATIAFLLFFLSPWQTTLTAYYLPELLTLCLVLLAIIPFFLPDERLKFLGLFSLVLLPFTGWTGLIFATTFGGLLFLTKQGFPYIAKQLSFTYTKSSFAYQTPHKLIFGVFLLLVLNLYLNKEYVVSTLNSSFLSSLSPGLLGAQVDERQRIDFLATGQTFTLLPVIRKILYNKPTFAFNKTAAHTIETFDFEQFAYPWPSYELIKLSGLSPKGNFQLGFFWQIPLTIFGIYLFLRNKNLKTKKLLIVLTTAALAPVLVFSKREFAQIGFLLLTALVLFQILAIYKLIRIIQEQKKWFLFTASAILAVFIIFDITDYHYTFFYKWLKHQPSHSFLSREIATVLAETKTDAVVTTRFGPTPLMSAFYLTWDPAVFWPEYLNKNETKTFNNITFRPFNLQEEKMPPDTLYVGLVGEFVEGGRNADHKPIPENLNVVKIIEGDEETVFEYGRFLWVAQLKE